ncbi:MAG: D-alanine--D-alanine ligase [Pseudomonadota bacterium]|nr:D-alanine--D-alanine ligase [Pseudomonadota bacterium]
MRIGFVYDLRDDYLAQGFSEEAVAEFDTRDTIAKISAALERIGAQVERIGHGRALAARLVEGARWDLVFSIAEGVSGRSREAQVPALCELFGQPYAFSDPLTCAATLDKAVAKRIVRDAGIPTAPFAVLHNAREAGDVAMPYPLFVKPLAEGTGKGCEAASRVHDAASLEKFARKLIRKFEQPVIVESYLPGREFTVGIVGNGTKAQVIGVVEIIVKPNGKDDVYSFANKENCETRVIYQLAKDGEARAAGVAALAAYRSLECRDAARLDFRSDERGQPHFLEANPLAGLHPEHSDLPISARLAGKTYDWLMGEIVHAAMNRYGKGAPTGSGKSLASAA